MNRSKTTIFVALITSGCGAASNQAGLSAAPTEGSGLAPAYSLAVENPADVPPCGALNQKQLVYIKSVGQLESCEQGAWYPIQLAQGNSQTGAKSSLVRVVAEAEGINCANGGQAIQTGADANGDGQLSAIEVSNVSYVCNGSSGRDGGNGRDGVSGLQIASTWTYHSDSYSSATDKVSVDGGPTGTTALIAPTYIGDITLTKFSDGSAFVSISGIEREITSGIGSNSGVVSPIWFEFSHTSFLTSSPTTQTLTFKHGLSRDERIRFNVYLGASPSVSATADNTGSFYDNPSDSYYYLTRQN